MVILHVATIKNNPFNGVCVVVPQHVTAQSDHAKVALLNTVNEQIGGISVQFTYDEGVGIGGLPSPYDKPDLVVFHECYRPAYLKIAGWLRKNSIPYVLVPHGELTKEAQKKKWLKKKVANFLLFNRFISGARAVQFLSHREMGLSSFGKRRFVGTNGTTVSAVDREDIGEKAKSFLYVGRLEVLTKGLDLMIKAVAKIKDEFANNGCTLSIYGPDYNGRYAEVESLIKENCVEDIVFLNREVSGEEKRKLLLSANVFVQTSRTEGMPLGILEALGMGIPVLITEGTTLGELVREYDAGYVAKTEVDDLAKTFLQAIRDKGELRDKSKNANRLALENFSWETVSKKTVEDYKNLCQ